MDAYTKLLFVLHIGSAIVGVGPTFAFAVLGPASAVGGQTGAAILESMLKISRMFVKPLGMVVLPVSGVLLIVRTNRDENFFDYPWLYVSIVLYIVILVLSLGVNNPAVKKILDMGKSGRAGTPEFMAQVQKTKVSGPIMTALALVIIVLMIWKPGE